MKLYYFYIIVWCVLSVPPAHAGHDADKLVAALGKKYEAMKDMTVTFTQTAMNTVTKKEQSISGTLTLKRGNKFRMELQGQTIVCDGSTTWTYTKTMKQVLVDTYREDAQTLTPDKIFTVMSDHYNAEKVGIEKIETGSVTVLVLTPHDRTTSLKQITIWVNERDSLLKKVIVDDLNNNRTTYSLETFKNNSGIQDSVFQFIPPRGVEVIDMR